MNFRKSAAIVSIVSILSLCSCDLKTSPTQVNNSPVSASTTSADGLSLTLNLNSSTFHSGDEVSIAVSELNTLDKNIRVDAADKWPVSGLIAGPMGRLNFPEGVAVFQGHLASSDLHTASPLFLYDPYAIYNLPAIFTATAYEFKPKSETCDVYQNADVVITNMSTNAKVAVDGYWIASYPAGFTTFSPGEYTVVAGDEWGKVVLLYFTVDNGAQTSQSPVQIVSLTGPLPPYNPGGPTVGITLKNVGNIPIVTMIADLNTDRPHPFNLLTTWSPLLPGQTVNATVNLIGPAAGSFSGDIPYPVTISGTLQDGTVFNYTFLMKIALPST